MMPSLCYLLKKCFNTQPPEGGWRSAEPKNAERASFNTQPPEGGWGISFATARAWKAFQHTAA